MLQKKAKIDIFLNDPKCAFHQWTAFEFAIASGNVGIVNLFLANHVRLNRKINSRFSWEIALEYASKETRDILEPKLRALVPVTDKRAHEALDKEENDNTERSAKRAKVDSAPAKTPSLTGAGSSTLFNRQQSQPAQPWGSGLRLTL